LIFDKFEKEMIDSFQSGRIEFQDLQQMLGAAENVRITEHQQRARLGLRDEVYGRLHDCDQRALAADQGAGDVEVVFGQQLVEVVPRYASSQLWIAGAYFVGVAVAQRFHRRVNFASPS